MSKSVWVIACCVALLLSPRVGAEEASARATFDRIRQAYQQQNVDELRTCLSAASLQMDEEFRRSPTGRQPDGSVLGTHYDLPRDLVFLSETREGDYTIITCIEQRPASGDRTAKGRFSDQQVEYVFISENGVWKWDTAASTERALRAWKQTGGGS